MGTIDRAVDQRDSRVDKEADLIKGQGRRGWLGLLLLALGLAVGGSLWPTATPPTAQGQTADNKHEIIYLSAGGIIRVHELAEPSDGVIVNWSSPEADGAWQDLAVGDLNGDGDDEIVAIRSEPLNGIDLAIYDPVIARGTNISPDLVEFVDNIPWRTLYAVDFPGDLEMVAVGEFDLATPGAEIFLSYRLTTLSETSGSPVTRRYLQILRRAAGDTDGTQWVEQIPPVETRIRWQTVRVGDINQDGADELVLTGEAGYLHVYRVDGTTLLPWIINESGTRPWNDAAIGQFLPGGPAEVAAVRNASGQLPRFWIFEFDPNAASSFRDGQAEYFAPSPKHIFFADINANGDDEVFLLRDSVSIPPAPTPAPPPRPHLIMRNSGGDALPPFEVILDADSGYQAGVGGDLDNDGRAEIIVARPERLRIFTQPEVNTAFSDYATSTDARTLRVGNLDNSGVLAFPVLASLPVNGAVVTLPAGQKGEAATEITLSLENSPGSFPFTVMKASDADWLTVEPTDGVVSSALPVTLRLYFDAYGLAPLQTYETMLLIDVPAGTPILNAPLAIPVALTVEPGLWPRPRSIWVYTACDEAMDAVPAIQKELIIDGLLAVPFTAQILPVSTNWLTYTPNPAQRYLPAVLDLTIEPAYMPASTEMVQAQVLVNAQNNQGEHQKISVSVTLACVRNSVTLPLIGNGAP